MSSINVNGKRPFCGDRPANAPVALIRLISNEQEAPDLSARHGLSQDFSAIRDRDPLYAIVERQTPLSFHPPR